MQGLESDIIGGFNAMIEKQRKLAGDAVCVMRCEATIPDDWKERIEEDMRKRR